MADFMGVMKHLPEDVVQYSVFPLIPGDLSEEDVRVYLQTFRDKIFAHLGNKIVQYIWQHESFNLRPVLASTSTDCLPPHLHGSTSYGDNIDDEWFIVYLLYEITREFSSTVARVSDSDEEFLLIEAAHEIPKWLDPETAQNRVYIYNGDLHVVPIPQSAQDVSKYPLFTPAVAEALACIRDCACETRCSQAVQNAMNRRLSGFPRKVSENTHHVNCYLPIPLVALLANYPSLVSAGVRSFYYRDPLELKACRPMKRFKPSNLMKTRVRMTRCLYAQLVQQKFSPDRSSGWPLVVPSNPEFLERDIGMKIAHGFEMLCAGCPDDGSVLDAQQCEDTDPRWQQFRKSLHSKGYFRGEMEGSQLHTKLLQEARQFFLSQIQSSELKDEHTGQLVLKLLKQLEPRMFEYSQQVNHLPPTDDDSWMNVTPEQVDEMMKTAGLGPADNCDLSQIAESMTAFVEQESGLEGAEFPREAAEHDGENGQFESSGLIQSMQKMFDFPDEESSTGSEMSEYDWSEGSDDELGSPSAIVRSVKKSSLRKTKPSQEGLQGSTSRDSAAPKSVRFVAPSTPSSRRQDLFSEASMASPVSQLEPSSLNRPTKLMCTSNGHSNHAASADPPPIPSRPARKKDPIRNNKPVAVVKPSAPPPPPPPQTGQRDKKLEAIMAAMDRELAATDVGKSFEREPRKPKSKPPGRPPPPPSMSRPGARKPPKNIEEEDDDFQPVSIDLNLIKNTLQSYKAQQGLPGPASNILAGFGISLPDDNAKNHSGLD